MPFTFTSFSLPSPPCPSFAFTIICLPHFCASISLTPSPSSSPPVSLCLLLNRLGNEPATWVIYIGLKLRNIWKLHRWPPLSHSLPNDWWWNIVYWRSDLNLNQCTQWLLLEAERRVSYTHAWKHTNPFTITVESISYRRRRHVFWRTLAFQMHEYKTKKPFTHTLFQTLSCFSSIISLPWGVFFLADS